MIHNLRALAIFAKAVDHGSFRQAAKELKVSPSVVSHHIAQLEEQLGVALLYRTTRKLSLTRDGEQLIGAARMMLKSAEDGVNAVLARSASVSGSLHVTAPALLANSPITSRIAQFVADHPNVSLSIDYSETMRDIIADGIDVAIRMGWLRDSTLKVVKLYSVERVLLAATSYLKTRPVPETPKDLEEWDWLNLSPVSLRPAFRDTANHRVTLRPTPRLSANSATALYELAARGAGLALLPRSVAEAGLQTGVVQVVLPHWRLSSLSIYAVRPQNAPRDSLAVHFINALARRGA
jgi:DNA-binding transcriptional LysR family regulator